MPFDPFAGFTAFTLPNGLRVHAATLPSANVQSIRCVINAGDYQGPQGLAHYTEHLVAHAKGTGEATILREELSALGGHWSGGSTGSTYSYYGFDIPAHLPQQYQHYCERLGRYVFQSTLSVNATIEKGIFLNEYRRALGSPFQQRLNHLESLINNPAHFYKGIATSFGNEDEILNRPTQAIADFYTRYYIPANATLITAGPLPLTQVESILNQTLGTIKASGTVALAVPPYTPQPCQQRGFALYSSEDSSASFLITAYHPFSLGFATLRLARNVYGKMANDLLREEKGLSYGINVSHYNLGDCYSLSMSGRGIDANQITPTLVALKELEDQIDTPLLEKTLTAKKQSLANSILADELTTPDLVESAIVRLRNYGRLLNAQEVIPLYEAVTPAALRPILHSLSITAPSYYRWKLPQGTSTEGIPLLDLDEKLKELENAALTLAKKP